MGEQTEQPQIPEPAPAPQAAPQPAAPQSSPAPVAGPNRLGILSFAVALGLTSAFVVFLLGIMAGLFGWGVLVVEVLSSLYIGYEPSFVGSIAGGVWGFVDGFFIGVVIAWLYNRLLRMRR